MSDESLGTTGNRIGPEYYDESGYFEAGEATSDLESPFQRYRVTKVLEIYLPGADERVLDLGCAWGTFSLALAPRVREVVGIDFSERYIDHCTAKATALGLDNVSFVHAMGADVAPTADVDLVLTFDCLHDMPRPDTTAAAVRDAIAADGTWLIKDIRSTGDFELDRRNPLLAMFYGFSIMSCLQSAMSEPDGLGLGTLGLHPAAAEELTTAAGFSSFVTHDFGDAANLYYEVRV